MKFILAAVAVIIAVVIGQAAAPHTPGGSYGPVPAVTVQAHSKVPAKLPPHKLPFHGLLRTLTGQQGYGQRSGGQQNDQGGDPGA